MKNRLDCNIADNSHARFNKKMELMESQINVLPEECHSKAKLINFLVENLFNDENRQTMLHHSGNTILTFSVADYH